MGKLINEGCLKTEQVGKAYFLFSGCFLFSCRMEYGGRCIDIDFCRHIVSSLSFAGILEAVLFEDVLQDMVVAMRVCP